MRKHLIGKKLDSIESKAANNAAAFWYYQSTCGAYLSELDGDMYWLGRSWAYECQNYCDEMFGGRFQVML